MRLQRLTIRNFRVLQEVTLDDLTPLTVLCGANGSGKSTLLDALNLFSEIFTDGVGPAWYRTRPGMSPYSEGAPLVVDLKIADAPESVGRVLCYRVELARSKTRFFIDETLWWENDGGSEYLLEFKEGRGWYRDEISGGRIQQDLTDDDGLAVAVFAQLQGHRLLKSLRDYFRGWQVCRPSPDSIRAGRPGEDDRLSKSGDNLFSVLLQLKNNKGTEYIFRDVLRAARRYIPLLSDAEPYETPDGTIGLQSWDRPLDTVFLAPHISDGTLQLLAYLTLLRSPRPAGLIGVDEPENQLHPKLLYPLAEEFRGAAGNSQVFIATHSPEFVNAIRPDELWAMNRGDDGYATVHRASRVPRVQEMVDGGASLGWLWSRNFLSVADPSEVLG